MVVVGQFRLAEFLFVGGEGDALPRDLFMGFRQARISYESSEPILRGALGSPTLME